MFQILAVEDNRDLNRTVCDFLYSCGYRATGCLCANDAYDAVYETLFDLIIPGFMMPDSNGFEFAKTVRSLNENIPILFMTARDAFASKQRGYRIGMDDYTVKPIDLGKPFLHIGALLRRAQIAFSRKLEVGRFIMNADTNTAPRAVDVYMTKLRAKLSDCQYFKIKTVHGLGYKEVIR